MKVSWSNRLGRAALRASVMTAVALSGLVGCAEEEPERVSIAFNVASPGGASPKQSVVAPSPELPPLDVSSFALNRPVHWVEVVRCDAESADCEERYTHNGYCGFETAFVAWETAMGVNFPDRFDDVLRGEPKIAGPIVYGAQPANAGWQSDAEPLVEGERYAISVYVYESCDQLDLACVHTKAVGCEFFTIEGGVPVVLPATVTDVSE